MPSSSDRLRAQRTADGLAHGWQAVGIPLRIYLTGPLCFEAGERVLWESALPGQQGRHLLALLVAEHRRPLSRDELASELWGDDLPTAWSASLKALISKLRSTLTGAGLPGGELIRNAFGAYQFRLPAGGWIDIDDATSRVHLAEAALAACDLEAAACDALVTRVIAARPFLPGVHGAWPELMRGRLNELRVRAIECMAEVYMRRGHAGEAIRSAQLALEVDELRESSWRILMRAHADAGNLGKALGSYELCRTLLLERLGTAPSPATRATHQELLR